MDIFGLTHELMSIESVTGNEGAACRWLRDYLVADGFDVITQPVTGDRFNIFARVGDPLVTFSTHIDTVPPYIAPRADEKNIYGRGACDAKGILAAQVFAAKQLRAEGRDHFGMLYVVGEEDGSDGALAANHLPNRNRYLINGEPTESHQAVASKGALRVLIEADGKIAHAAYPECGESAIEKLLDVLDDIRRMDLPSDTKLGVTTCNIGTITGGRKANVVPDYAASELMFRTVNQPDELFQDVVRVVGGRARVTQGFCIVPIHINAVAEMPHIPTSVVRFGTDIPCLTNWGEPLLFGPGSIHDAHTTHEFVSR
ncbi:MAG: M20/M25/M40 family metallo-hydrolase, partial [Blastocatellia bacterium]